MRSTVLVDAGAIVALLNRRDRYHKAITELVENFEGTWLTTWAVIGEACALLGERRQKLVLDWIAETDTRIVSIDDGLDFMRAQMSDYADLPCDFADASLLYAAWRTKVREIWSIDSDFGVYRLPDRSRFIVFPR